MEQSMKLCELPVGQCAKIEKINADESIKRRLLDLGMVRNTKVRTVLKSPSGDPRAYEVRGAVIALREDVSSAIQVGAAGEAGR